MRLLRSIIKRIYLVQMTVHVQFLTFFYYGDGVGLNTLRL